MSTINVTLQQTGATTTKATIRNHSVSIDRPEAKGGSDAGAMGGELLLASLGGCFSSNLLAAILSRDADIKDVTVTVSGTLEGSPARFTAIDMQVAAVHQDTALLEKLVIMSERACIVANTLKDSVTLTVSVSSAPIVG